MVDSNTGSVTLLTFGHGTATQEQITELLHGAGVQQLVDVRTAPGSRRNPHVGRDELQRWLPETGIEYRWERALGGFRKAAPDSPDVAWRNASFRGYADYMDTPAFQEALAALAAHARATPTAFMCAEGLWWQCHRGLIADRLKADGWHVLHIDPRGAVVEHPYTPAARIVDGRLDYGGQGQLGLPSQDAPR